MTDCHVRGPVRATGPLSGPRFDEPEGRIRIVRILFAETNWAGMALARDLHQAGFFLTRGDDGADLIDFADLAQQDIIIVDADLPDMPSIDCLRMLRCRHPAQAIAFAIGKADQALALRAYAAGADLVFAHRVDRRELVARLVALGRRSAGFDRPLIPCGDVTIDCSHRAALVHGRRLDLTRIEYELLEYLALRPGQVVPKAGLMTHLYAFDDHPDDRIIAAYICHIRAKIGAAGGNPDLIQNNWGRGYALTAAPGQRMAA